MGWEPAEGKGEEWDGDLDNQVDDFFERYPVDDRVQGYVRSSPAFVVKAMLNDFNPRSEGEQDYSGLITSFLKKVRLEQGVAPLPAWANSTNFKPGDWLCPRCGDLQFGRNDTCRMCQTQRPDSQDATAHPVGPTPPVTGALPGDWICPACSHLNFARNSECRRCGEPRPGLQQTIISSSSGHGQPPSNQMADEADEFCRRYPMDDPTYDHLLESSSDVQLRVIREFRPSREGGGDYSQLMRAFINKCRADEEFDMLQGGGAPERSQPVPTSRQPAPAGGKGFVPVYATATATATSQVPCKFFLKGNCAKGAECRFAHNVSSFPVVQVGPAPQAQPGKGYSGLRPRHGGLLREDPQGPVGKGVDHRGPIKAWGGSRDNRAVEAFFRRYPVDGRARDYFLQAPLDTQQRVIQDFKPRYEGEADYSSLLMAFTKRCNTEPGFQPVRQQPVGSSPVEQRWADRRDAPVPNGARFEPAPRGGAGGSAVGLGPGKEGCQSFRERYPMDDRAYDYLCSSSPEVCRRVINTFLPQRPDDREFSAAVTAYVRACRREMENGVPQQPGPANPPIDVVELDQATDDFFRRYPCDNRAIAFLKALEPRVCDRVLREFIPKREGDSDYSAIVMSFAKRCLGDSEAEPAWKRARH